ncbi:MAG: hypothetical protein Q8K07_17115, partial [Methylicorpusculum sp.]|uniref:hypothetical protein n=1 Tax=Methylicorpusculum sp. TaxID=2713644 RepID=UPI00272F1027
VSRCLAGFLRKLRKPARRYGYRGLKIFTSLALRFQDFQRAQWLTERRALLDVAIKQESERWAILTSRYAGIKAQVHPG